MFRVFLNCFQLLQIRFCCSKNGPFSFYRNPIFINWKKNYRVCLSFLGALKNNFQRAWHSLWLVERCQSLTISLRSKWTGLAQDLFSASYVFLFYVLVVSFCFLSCSILLWFVLYISLYTYTCMPFAEVSLFCEPLNNSYSVSCKIIMNRSIIISLNKIYNIL